MHKRAKRIDTEMVSAFADGTTIFRGQVANISRTGLKIINIPKKFRPSTKKYSTIISSNNKKFKLKILPVWFDHTGYKLEIGFKIIAPPTGWLSFLDQTIGQMT